MRRQRIVVDTNVLISRVLIEDSVAGRAVRLAEDRARLLASRDTLEEFATVLLRPKFDKYAEFALRAEFLIRYRRIVEMITIDDPVRACRDPKDDKFLSLAVNGEADQLISGDKDLLELDPFRRTRILTPAAWLEL